jgi:hypothetical protein
MNEKSGMLISSPEEKVEAPSLMRELLLSWGVTLILSRFRALAKELAKYRFAVFRLFYSLKSTNFSFW